MLLLLAMSVPAWPKLVKAAVKAVPPPEPMPMPFGAALAAVGAATALLYGPAIVRWFQVRLSLLLVQLALLHLSEGGHLFSSWHALFAWPLFQFELNKLISLEVRWPADVWKGRTAPRATPSGSAQTQPLLTAGLAPP